MVLLAYTYALYHHSLPLIVNTANLLTGSLTTLIAATIAIAIATTIAIAAAIAIATTIAVAIAVFEGPVSLFN